MRVKTKQTWIVVGCFDTVLQKQERSRRRKSQTGSTGTYYDNEQAVEEQNMKTRSWEAVRQSWSHRIIPQ